MPKYSTYKISRRGPKCPVCGNFTRTVWYFNIDCWYRIYGEAYCYTHGIVKVPYRGNK